MNGDGTLIVENARNFITRYTQDLPHLPLTIAGEASVWPEVTADIQRATE